MRIAKTENRYVELLAEMATRHGLITGATGSGKTVSIKVLAEAFSEAGVPVFVQDVKGDLSGFVEAGEASEKFLKHLAKYGGQEPNYQSYPTVFWDIFEEQGHPLRTTISEMGPLMLSQLLGLNETQMGVVYTIFKIADDKGWLMLDLKDFSAMLNHVALEHKSYRVAYGSMHPRSIGAIKRKVMMMEADGLDHFFGEPAFNINDFMQRDSEGKGYIHILNAQKIAKTPSTYASFLLWLLAELFEELPEVGDVAQPKLVFFFDEAHILFDRMPQYLMEKVEQVIKLIRSKGVAIFFVTQNPADIPDAVLAQLGNRIQHVLRAYTPKEQKAVRIAANSFRENEQFDTEEAITSLGVGQALVSFLDEDGVPNKVARAWILAPKSKIGPADLATVQRAIKSDKVGGYYDDTVDRESAFEVLRARAETRSDDNAEARPSVQRKKMRKRSDSPLDKLLKSASTAIGSQLGRQLVRGVLGSLSKRRR